MSRNTPDKPRMPNHALLRAMLVRIFASDGRSLSRRARVRRNVSFAAVRGSKERPNDGSVHFPTESNLLPHMRSTACVKQFLVRTVIVQKLCNSTECRPNPEAANQDPSANLSMEVTQLSQTPHPDSLGDRLLSTSIPSRDVVSVRPSVGQG
jgi:hypothetical protein